MYISTKPVHFTDEELERIHTAINSAYEDIANMFAPGDDPDAFSQRDLARLAGICEKIETHGIFTVDK